MNDDGAYEVVRKYARQARVDCHPHALRHTFATLYLQDNPSDLVGPARLLSHDSLNTAMCYTLPTTEMLAEMLMVATNEIKVVPGSCTAGIGVEKRSAYERV